MVHDAVEIVCMLGHLMHIIVSPLSRWTRCSVVLLSTRLPATTTLSYEAREFSLPIFRKQLTVESKLEVVLNYLVGTIASGRRNSCSKARSYIIQPDDGKTWRFLTRLLKQVL